MRRKAARTLAGASVRLSVCLDGETHRKLRALALVRQTTIQDIVAGLVEDTCRGVRLPSIGPERNGNDPPATPQSM